MIVGRHIVFVCFFLLILFLLLLLLLFKRFFVTEFLETVADKAVKQPTHRMQIDKLKEAEQIQEGLGTGILFKSESRWASPICSVIKVIKIHIYCQGYKMLLMLWSQLVQHHGPCSKLSSDWADRKWQRMLCFLHQFEFNVMSFGMSTAPAIFQCLMDRVLAGLQWDTCLVYLDDVI